MKSYFAAGGFIALCLTATAVNFLYQPTADDLYEGALFLGAGLALVYLLHVLHLYIQKAMALADVDTINSLKAQLSRSNQLREAELETHHRAELHLMGQIVRTIEAQNDKTSMNLHDGPTQTISAGNLLLEAFKKNHGHYHAHDPVAVDDLEEVTVTHKVAISECRVLIDDLKPMVLTDFGLPAAIREKVTALNTLQRWNVVFEQTPEDSNIRHNSELEHALYRVLLEAIQNTSKHASANNILVELHEPQADHITLSITDDGRGFDTTLERRRPDPSGPGERVGLRAIRERIALQGGDLFITSSPGKGTQIIAKVPLDEGTEERPT